MKKGRSKIKSSILLRVRFIYFLFMVLAVVILLRLIWIQFISHEVDYNARRLATRIFTEVRVPAQRGSILSRDDEPLAISIFRHQAYFDFAAEGLDSLNRFHEQSDSLAQLLSAFFKDKSAAEYRRFFRREHSRRYRLVRPRDTVMLRSEGWFSRWLDRIRGEEFVRKRIYDTLRDHTPVPIFPREVDFAEWDILRRYPLLNWNMGMVYNLRQSDKRIYPQGGLARRVIGDMADTVRDKRGHGIEESHRRELAGRDGKIIRQRIARGSSVRLPGGHNVEAKNGYDIVTTIDVELQDVADKALRRQIERHNAKWGTTIVMDTRTGEILAMANLGRNADGSIAETENYALGRSMEPGSTFKLASMLLLLDDADMSPDTEYDTGNGDPVKVGPVRGVRDSHRGDKVISFERAVAASSNVYFARAVWDRYGITGKKFDYSNFLRDNLRLGETVGLEYLGERKPYITEDWKVPDPGVMLVKMSYGYRVKLAPIQILTFYNAIANDGRMISPILIKEYRHEGRVVEEFESKVLRGSICSRSTLREVRHALEKVCTEGTARQFFGDTTRVKVAAKTGTAQVTSYAQGDRHYLGSMVAFFPAENPRYTVLTSIETKFQPGKAYYGTGLAGPVVKRMVDYIYNRSYDSTETLDRDMEYFPTHIKGGDIAQVREVADAFSPDVDYDERKGWGRVTVDTLSRVKIKSLDNNKTVPNVIGMGLKDALFLLESRGLRVRFSGRGTVYRQNIKAGTVAKTGTVIEITLR